MERLRRFPRPDHQLPEHPMVSLLLGGGCIYVGIWPTCPYELAVIEIEKMAAIKNVRSLRIAVSMTSGPERPDAAKGDR